MAWIGWRIQEDKTESHNQSYWSSQTCSLIEKSLVLRFKNCKKKKKKKRNLRVNKWKRY